MNLQKGDSFIASKDILVFVSSKRKIFRLFEACVHVCDQDTDDVLPSKVARVAHLGNYSFEFALCTHPTHENRQVRSNCHNRHKIVPDQLKYHN